MSSLEPQRDPLLASNTRAQDKCEQVMQFNAQNPEMISRQSTTVGRTGRSQQNKRKSAKGLAAASTRTRNGQQQQQQQEEGASPEFSGLSEREPRPHSAMPVRRPKTTQRVRINSTSEQIQDPNWLLQMADQLEQPTKTRNKRTSHLRTLHMKLKSSLIGSQANDTSSAGNVSLTSIPVIPVQTGLPSSPAKIPVSILKQPSQSIGSPTTLSSSGQLKAHIKPRKSRTSGNSNGSSSKRNGGGSEKGARTKQQQPVAVKGEQKSTLTTMVLESNTKLAPICADGQVKVSSWKRNNLLAKTLSHLDEIRGNQRPIFVPTKIQLPSNTGEMITTTTEQENPTSGIVNMKSSAKFADVVKAALLASRRQTTEVEQITLSNTGKRRSAGSNSSASNSDHQTVEQSDHTVASTSRANLNNNVIIAELGQPQVLLPAQTCQAHRSNSTCLSTPTVSITKQPATQSVSLTRNQTINQSRPSHHLLETSARQYKLAHKNQQVLQHLRRQSNEIQAASVAASENHQTQKSSSGHLKDWKRLASQLALLGTGGGSKPVSNWASLPANCQRLLNIENTPLRLTVSNEESGGAESGRRSSSSRLEQKQQYLKRNSLLSVPPLNSTRKLSSSSMIVGQSGRLLPCDSSDYIKKGGHSNPASSPRRSSDSEAYRLQASQQQWNRTDHLLKEKSSPLVVNRTDLLQLLQVTSAGSSVGSARRSLQLNESGVQDSAATRNRSSSIQSVQLTTSTHNNHKIPSRTEPKTSTPTHSCKEPTRESEEFEKKEEKEEEEEEKEKGEGEEEEEEEEKKGEDKEKEELKVDEKVTSSCKLESGKSKRRDLSWVVKKTSRVAFFQEKLRRIRWRKSRAADQEPQEAEGTPISRNKSQKESHEKPQAKDNEVDGGIDGKFNVCDNTIDDEQASPELLGMDPTLIGDAIEIFLRSAMQSNAHDSDCETEKEEEKQQQKDGLEGPTTFDYNNNIQSKQFKLSSSSSTLSKEMVAGESQANST